MLRKTSFLLALFLLGFSSLMTEARTETGFLNRTLKSGSTTYRYQVYVPANWDAKKKTPIVLFLHGAGERGDDGVVQTEVGIGGAVRRHADRAQCVIVFPQCPKNRWWSEPEMQAMALKTLEVSAKEFSADPARTYLTGLSMGGYGSWTMASTNPGKFAAVAVICGGVRPVWIFHGGADTVVPTSESRKMHEALKASGGNVKYSEYEGVGHNSWDKAYNEPDFFSWLLSHRKN